MMAPICAPDRPPSALIRTLSPLSVFLIPTVFFAFGLFASAAFAQQLPTQKSDPVKEEPTGPVAPAKVDVQPVARDDEIRDRLSNILKATGWFQNIDVQVNESVVFLDGETDREHYRKWAGELASNTQDVAAVVNRLEIVQPPLLGLSPALEELRRIWYLVLQALPRLVVAMGVIVLFWFLARGMRLLVSGVTRYQIHSPLLRDVIAKAGALLVILLGFYLALQLIGLARLAVTVIGGTGLLGLVIGIAFRDITENFLASIYLSVQRPFRSGDLVDIDGSLGYVQRLTTRTTILMTLDGNHVQIPNATVFKSTLRNYTSNPQRRVDFAVGIGYEDSIAEAQQLALQVLEQHPVVSKHPEPWVLAESLGAATVNLRVYFWMDGREHSWLKVRSSVIRLVKRAFQEAGISMPDAEREIVFPDGVPVRMLGQDGALPAHKETEPKRVASREPKAVSTDAEGGFVSDADEISRQARQSRSPEEGAGDLQLKNVGEQNSD